MDSLFSCMQHPGYCSVTQRMKQQQKNQNIKSIRMTPADNSTSPSNSMSLAKRMIIGAGIGLSVILIFVIPGDENPAWGKLWMIRPLIVTPFAGAIGGLCNH